MNENVYNEINRMRMRLGSKYPIPIKFDIEDYYKMGAIKKRFS